MSSDPAEHSVDLSALPPALARLRRFPLDEALLLFDRDTGLTAICDGPETRHLRRRAPRVVQMAITNHCNLACTFCSRSLDASSDWTPDEAFDLLAGLARAGTLEVAFGGGEPFAFRGIDALVRRLHDETPLAVSLTTNGLLLTPTRLRALDGAYGQLRLSLYDDNHWPETVALLARERARFGANLLVTPARLPELEATLLRLVALGCRDVLLLSYNGADGALHLSTSQSADLARRVDLLARALEGRVTLKLSVCWGERLEPVPRLDGATGDCGAGRDFVVVTSDRRLMPCSFHHLSIPARTAADVLAAWSARATELAGAARVAGCARLSGFGLQEAS